MDRLAGRIKRDLEERHFCVVFEDEIERCWPKEKLGPMERERQIQAFAKSRAWNASIHNSEGFTRAIILPW
jgi:hypothetical protein